MLYNTERQAIEAILKSDICKVAAQLKIGTFYYDCANWASASPGIGYPDAFHVCDVLGIRVFRMATLGNGKYSYRDMDGTVIASN